MTRYAVIGALCAAQAWALEPGAWESFSTTTNADAWVLYDYGDEGLYFPGWLDGLDPSIESPMTGDGVWFYGDSLVADGAFTGDYATANVSSISVDVYLEDPTLLGVLDMVIYSAAEGVERYYYSAFYVGDDFVESGWYPLEFSLADPWFHLDATGNALVEAPWSASDLSNIDEVGLRFFPVDGNTTQTFVGIDNVVLNHPVVTPDLAISAASGTVTVSFQREAAHQYTIERFDAGLESWEVEPGLIDIVGTDPFSFETPATGTGLFRCVAGPAFVEVVTTP